MVSLTVQQGVEGWGSHFKMTSEKELISCLIKLCRIKKKLQIPSESFLSKDNALTPNPMNPKSLLMGGVGTLHDSHWTMCVNG